jgi:hypothetical protein
MHADITTFSVCSSGILCPCSFYPFITHIFPPSTLLWTSIANPFAALIYQRPCVMFSYSKQPKVDNEQEFLLANCHWWFPSTAIGRITWRCLRRIPGRRSIENSSRPRLARIIVIILVVLFLWRGGGEGGRVLFFGINLSPWPINSPVVDKTLSEGTSTRIVHPGNFQT